MVDQRHANGSRIVEIQYSIARVEVSGDAANGAGPLLRALADRIDERYGTDMWPITLEVQYEAEPEMLRISAFMRDYERDGGGLGAVATVVKPESEPEFLVRRERICAISPGCGNENQADVVFFLRPEDVAKLRAAMMVYPCPYCIADWHPCPTAVSWENVETYARAAGMLEGD